MRIVPSQVVTFILTAYPMDRALAALYPTMAPPDGLPQLKEMVLGMEHRAKMVALLNLVAGIPPALLTFPPAAQAQFVIATSTIQARVQEWDQNRLESRLKPTDLLGNENPVHTLYRLLKGCSDEVPETTTVELHFVSDTELRAGLRLDISGAHRALSHGEWKAATVLAGSVIEALLLWALKTRPPADIKACFERAKATYEAREKADGNNSSFGAFNASGKWKFFQIIGLAEEAGYTSRETAKAANLAREYRNLIHADAAERKSAVCGIDTAHSAIGALEAAVRDLTQRFQTT